MTAEIITVPTSSCVASVIMTMTRAVARTNSPFTYETQSFRWPGEQWSMEFSLPSIVSRAIASEWIAFAMKLKGSYNYFRMGDPAAPLPQGIATGTPVVNAINQTGNTLTTSGWTTSTTNILKAGDYFQVGDHLHMITQNINSNGSGVANLVFEPALRESPALNAPITVTNAKGLWRLEDNSFSWSVNPGPVYSISFRAIEVINA